MKKILPVLLMMILCSCGRSPHQADSQPEQTSAVSETVTQFVQDLQHLPTEAAERYTPLNYDRQRAVWLPYVRYPEYMTGKSSSEFRTAVGELFSQAASQGINTVYVHVHPCGDAYYDSDIFPVGSCLDADYDPLAIMLEEAHSRRLSVHAWINPLRCQTIEEMRELPDDFIIKKWTDTPGCHIVREVNGRWYLDPACPETDELIKSCVEEIIEKYDVDGIHIDDYFYPTTDTEFDREEFEASGSDDLAAWRMDNCTRFVKTIYDTVNSCDSRVLFGISPQGSISGNYESQYADVKLWGGVSGYCDYIVPQIYFGFLNETSPFDKTLSDWEELVCPEVDLVIGLGVYKTGRNDKWAGAAGETEWIDDPDIIKKQVSLVENSSAEGIAFYR